MDITNFALHFFSKFHQLQVIVVKREMVNFYKASS